MHIQTLCTHGNSWVDNGNSKKKKKSGGRVFQNKNVERVFVVNFKYYSFRWFPIRRMKSRYTRQRENKIVGVGWLVWKLATCYPCTHFMYQRSHKNGLDSIYVFGVSLWLLTCDRVCNSTYVADVLGTWNLLRCSTRLPVKAPFPAKWIIQRPVN